MAKDNGTIHATLLQFSWYSHIQVYGPESWGNINQLRNKSVDIFGIKDQETIDSLHYLKKRLLVVLLLQQHLTINTIN